MAPSTRLSRSIRVIATVLILFHLWAVVGRPIEFATQGPFGTSPSATLFRMPVRAYSQFTYLDHGYAFFAPDPGPSHLIAVTLTNPDGQNIDLKYPDLNDQWPRLLYHRHFMLAEFFNDIYHPPGNPPAEIANNTDSVRDWHMARRRYETVRDSITTRLVARHRDHQIKLRRLEHRQPGLPEFFEAKMPLNDPRLITSLDDLVDGSPELPEASTPMQSQILPQTLRPTTRENTTPSEKAPVRDAPTRLNSAEQVRPIRVEEPTDMTGESRQSVSEKAGSDQ